MTERICAVDGCGRPMPTGDNSTACPRCWNILMRDLGQIPSLVEELETTICRQAATTLRNGPRSNEKPLPYNVAASDVLRDLHSTMWGWVKAGLEARPEARTPNPGTIGLSRALLGLLGWLVTDEHGYLACDEVGHAVKRAERVIDRAPDRWYAGVCGGAFADVICIEDLYGTEDKPTVRCPVCSTEYDLAERRWAMLQDSGETLLTLSEMTRAIGMTGGDTVTRKQLEGWVRRGRLVRAGNNGPIATYRVADVEALVRPMRHATT